MKHAAILLAGCLCLNAQAQSAAGQASEMPGKLFLSPEKRHSLDRQRQLNLREDDGLDHENLRLDGVVLRSSGYNSVWINQRMQPQVQTPGRAGADASSSPVEIEQGRQIRLQVGESVNRNTQERKNVLPSDAIQPDKRR
jgi:hypothetical protein